MPEIAEVYRAADYIRQHLVGRTLAIVKAQHDENVFGKVGTSAAEIEKALTGKKIVGAGQQGKYFWITMASPPHLLCHFGMAGWFHIKGIPTFYYKDTKKDKAADKEWPPKHWKFSFQTKPEGKDKTVLDAAFVDFRRFARVRLIDCATEDIRKISPLVDNGPDPNTDKDIVTRDWLAALCQRKKVPIKALLLNQANISGIGNWVGDEVLFQARMHPEQYSNTLSEDQITELHKQIMTVVDIAIETKSDSDQFPKTWLFKHRWGKGRKLVYQMPNGDKIIYLTVGGRTSAIVPSLQKKTGPVAGDISEKESKKPAGTKKAKRKRKQIDEDEEEDDDDEEDEDEDEDALDKTSKIAPIKPTKPTKRSKKTAATDDLPPTATAEEVATAVTKEPEPEPQPKRNRRSTTKPKDEPQSPQNKRLKGGGLPADTVKTEAEEPEKALPRRSRKSNPRLPPTQTAEETQRVLDESNAKRVPGRGASTVAKDGTGSDEKKVAKKDVAVAKGGGKKVEESIGRRRSGRISAIG